ncbi:unnamed protein product [Trifolium pratense]|uniref:Uncharacterized protein n=1 Tax=Trifolium pratense TaxID=57577 RepID=A0ACB0JPR7_TRIPR|nr:unnamed protein product [Trifolium pratense]
MGSWNKEEITMFYESYRNQGKDLEKGTESIGYSNYMLISSLFKLYLTFTIILLAFNFVHSFKIEFMASLDLILGCHKKLLTAAIEILQ